MNDGTQLLLWSCFAPFCPGYGATRLRSVAVVEMYGNLHLFKNRDLFQNQCRDPGGRWVTGVLNGNPVQRYEKLKLVK